MRSRLGELAAMKYLAKVRPDKFDLQLYYEQYDHWVRLCEKVTYPDGRKAWFLCHTYKLSEEENGN